MEDDFENLMSKAPQWLDEFIQNQDDPKFLKDRINIPAWIHLSSSRLSNLLDQIDRSKKTTDTKVAHKSWPQIVRKYQGTDSADSLYAVIEYGLREPDALKPVLELLIHLISIPSVRLKLEPLIHDTLFMVRLPDRENNLINLLEYYLSFHCTIDEGTLTWKQMRKNYNNIILRFQSCIFSNLTIEEQADETNINPLISATEKQLNDPIFIQRHLSELNPDIFEKLKEEFGIIPRNVSPEESKNLAIAGLARALISPVDPNENIPPHLMPTKLPPYDIAFPKLGRHALCLIDAVLQVFQEKRVTNAKEVMSFIEKVKAELNATQYSKHCCPLIVPPAISMNSGEFDEKSCFSIILDSQFLNYDFTAPEVGDMVYLLSSEEGYICPFLIVSCVSKSSFIAHIECDHFPEGNFDVLIKLPPELRYDIERLIHLPKILSCKNISEKVVDSFIGLANRDKLAKPPITVVETPPCTSPSIDAAVWLSEQHLINPKKKTIIFASNVDEIDLFVSKFCMEVGKYPSMNILRLDFQSDVAIEILWKSRKELLSQVEKIDKSFAFSCATAINSLKLYRESLRVLDDEQKSLAPVTLDEIDAYIRQLEFIRPLEYIADPQKILDYLKKSSQIICHLIGDPIKISDNKEIKVDNCIILDSCIIEDSDLLWIMSKANPSNIRLYGHGEAFRRLSMMPDDVVNKETVNMSIRKSPAIYEFLGFESRDEGRVAPGVISTCHFWFEMNLLKSFEVAVASTFLFSFLGYKKIMLVVDNDEYVNRAELILLKRASWSRQLKDKLKDCVYSADYVIKKNLTADVVIYLETLNLKNTRVAEMANAASFVFWSVYSPHEEIQREEILLRLFDNTLVASKLEKLFENHVLNHQPQVAQLAFNENFDDKDNPEKLKNRTVYNVDGVDQLLGLVYSMQLQIHSNEANQPQIPQ